MAALTHSSYLHEHPLEDGAEDFERLEFLGDAVVDLVIGDELYRRFPDATEGKLTTLRAQMVSSAALAEIARELGLPERARLGRGEEESGGRSRAGLAASLYESLVGAIYVESGLDTAREVIGRTMSKALDATAATPRRSPKTLLQEWAQARGFSLPTYEVVEVAGPQHHREFVVKVDIGGKWAQGSGRSKREAQEEAAAALLRDVE